MKFIQTMLIRLSTILVAVSLLLCHSTLSAEPVSGSTTERMEKRWDLKGFPSLEFNGKPIGRLGEPGHSYETVIFRLEDGTLILLEPQSLGEEEQEILSKEELPPFDPYETCEIVLRQLGEIPESLWSEHYQKAAENAVAQLGRDQSDEANLANLGVIRHFSILG